MQTVVATNSTAAILTDANGRGKVVSLLGYYRPAFLDHSNANTTSAAGALTRTEYRISRQSFVGAESERES